MQICAARLLEEHAPDGFIKDLHDAFARAYRDAKVTCGARHFEEEQRNLLPFARRAEVEHALKEVAIRHNLKYTSVQNGSFWYTTRIFFGNIILDAAHVPTRLAMVRHSDYRETSAESNQLVFDFMKQDKPLDDKPIYGIVLHGEDDERSSELAYMDIAFPEHTLSDYVDYVDVLGMFRKSVVTPIKPSAPGNTDDETPVLKLRKPGGTRKKKA